VLNVVPGAAKESGKIYFSSDCFFVHRQADPNNDSQSGFIQEPIN
jgi:hypothetical protein